MAEDREDALGVEVGRRQTGVFAQFDAMRDVASAMAKGADAETVFALVAEHAADMVDADGCALVRFEEDGAGRLTGHWARDGMFPDGVPTHVPPEGDSAIPTVHRTGRPAIVDSYEALDDPRSRLLHTEYRSGAAVPITVGMASWGALAVGSRRPAAFGERTVALLEDYAELIAMTVTSPVPESRSGLEALLDSLLTSAPVGFAYLSLDGLVLRANAAFAAVGGTVASQLAGRPVEDLVDRFPMLSHSNLDEIARTGREILDVPTQITDGGETKYLVTSFYPVRARDVAGIGVVVVDVTPERRAAEDLRRERNYSAALIDALQDGLAVTALDGTLVDVNDRFCEITGFPRTELIGCRPPYPYWPPARANELRTKLLDAMGGTINDDPVEFIRADGTSMAAVLARAPLRTDAGEMRGMVATVRDVTAERHAERERQGLLTGERRARRRAQLLHGLGSALSRALTPREVRDAVIEHATGHLGASCCDVLERAPAGATSAAGRWPCDWLDAVDSATLAAIATSGVATYLDHPAAVEEAFPGLHADGRTYGAIAIVPLGGESRGGRHPGRGVRGGPGVSGGGSTDVPDGRGPGHPGPAPGPAVRGRAGRSRASAAS